MTDDLNVVNEPGGFVELPLDQVLLVLLQQLHDVVANLIADLGERGIIDPDVYLADEAIEFDVVEGPSRAA